MGKTIEKINKTHVVNYKTRFSALFSVWCLGWVREVGEWNVFLTFAPIQCQNGKWKTLFRFFIIQFYVCLLGNLVLVLSADMHGWLKCYMYKLQMYHVPVAGVNFEYVFGHEWTHDLSEFFSICAGEFKCENFGISGIRYTVNGYSSTKYQMCMQYHNNWPHNSPDVLYGSVRSDKNIHT